MRWLGVAFAVIVVGVVLYKISYPTYAYRYRVTVEVEGQMRSGSSVVEARVSKQLMFLPDVDPLAYSVHGEAVHQVLGGRGGIVALLASGEYANDADYPRFLVSGPHFKLDLFDDRKFASLPALRGKWELPSNQLPTPVAFSDPDNSATSRVIRPDKLEQLFGPNVLWRGIVVEMAADPVTHDLEARLPLLVSEKKALRDPIRDSNWFVPKYHAFLRS
jgi:hypothetical protein